MLVPGASGAHAQETPPLVESLLFFHEFNRKNVIAAAEAMPESAWAFQPTSDVRTYGQLVAHIADTLYFACSGMRGEPNPIEKDHRPGVVGEDSIERNRTTKAEVVRAVKESFAYCEPAFAEAAKPAPADAAGGADRKTWSFRAMLAVYHTGGHYGNMVTYLRLKGLVPPSSSGR
jgi:hypothetical protein